MKIMSLLQAVREKCSNENIREFRYYASKYEFIFTFDNGAQMKIHTLGPDEEDEVEMDTSRLLGCVCGHEHSDKTGICLDPKGNCPCGGYTPRHLNNPRGGR